MYSTLVKCAAALALVMLLLPRPNATAQSYTSNLSTTPPPHIVAIGKTNDPLFKMGYLDVTLYNGWNTTNPVDPNGNVDSTVALQKALDDAFDYQLVAYFPFGTYKVSKTLFMVRKSINARGHSCNITGSNAAGYPIIKLATSASGFGNASSPKPVIHFHAMDGSNAQPFGTPSASAPVLSGDGASVNFTSSIQNLVVDCSGNAGAVGIRFYAAQASGVHHVKVPATGAYAGFQGLPSRSSGGASNLEVIAGQYGLLLDTGAGSALANIVLTNQTVAAIKSL